MGCMWRILRARRLSDTARATLGVAVTASQPEIKQAYRALTKGGTGPAPGCEQAWRGEVQSHQAAPRRWLPPEWAVRLRAVRRSGKPSGRVATASAPAAAAVCCVHIHVLFGVSRPARALSLVRGHCTRGGARRRAARPADVGGRWHVHPRARRHQPVRGARPAAQSERGPGGRVVQPGDAPLGDAATAHAQGRLMSTAIHLKPPHTVYRASSAQAVGVPVQPGRSTARRQSIRTWRGSAATRLDCLRVACTRGFGRHQRYPSYFVWRARARVCARGSWRDKYLEIPGIPSCPQA